MKTLWLIGAISGISLIVFGFLHISLLDKIIEDKIKLKWWASKITLSLAIVFFGCALAFLVNALIQ